jgi:phosphoribosylamine--glycine ligase
MERHGIAGCPEYQVFHDPEEARQFIESYDGDLAVKPIGLTGGKGVRIMGEHVDSAGAVEYVREIGGDVVLEERLVGEEFTLQAFVDGEHLVPMPLVQDHKRAYEGDVGPNTGGMGSYSMQDHMLPFVTGSDYEKALRIMEDTVAAMRSEGTPYRGILYGQFMNTRDGPRVIEFNARFGDPEAMNVLSLLEPDLSEIVCHIADGDLSPSHVRFAHKATVCKYLVPEGYPSAPMAHEPLTLGNYGDALLYYANVEEQDGTLYTQTSRTLAFVGMGETLDEAEAIAEKAASSVRGHVFHRRDIGTRAILDKRCRHMKEIA